MKYITSLDEELEFSTAITIGKFDGLHLGHKVLLHYIMEQKFNGRKSTIVTFENSPRIVLHKDNSQYLITNEERRKWIENSGIDILVELCFNKELMKLSPEEFIKLLCDKLHMEFLVVGTDFRFGYKGLGNVTLLKKLSEMYHFELVVIEKVKDQQREISSTYIREEMKKGNIAKVNELLGYEYFVGGKIIHGAHLGSKIGIPTINMIPKQEKLLPCNGVYLTKVLIENREYVGVTNVGCKPTVSGDGIVGIETHILDFKQQVYDKDAIIFFYQFLRKEKKFSSVEELCNQMNKDIEQARLLCK